MTTKLERDLRTLAEFIEVYCAGQHSDRSVVTLPSHDVTALMRREVRLCPACRKLLAHAFVKRSHCPFDPKPACKRCPDHCYHPRYREQIRTVMRYAGWRLVLRGRLHYLLRLAS